MKLTLSALALLSALVLAPAVSAVPLIMIDQPATGAIVGRTFTVHGTALNTDTVHVWAFPAAGSIFLGAVTPNQIDLTRQLATGRFALLVTDAPIGVYPIVAYAHDPALGNFPSQAGRMMDVRACVMYTVHWLFWGPNGLEEAPRPFCGAE